MTALTEGAHACEFILSEANGNRSRENGTVASGQDIEAGTVLMGTAGALVALTAVGTAGDLDGTVIGILLYNIDASAGALPASYLARDAEVNGDQLIYPTESTAGGEEAAANTALKSLGIIVR